MRIKDNKKPDKINSIEEKRMEHISFNLKHLTSNKAFCLKWFGNDFRNREKALSELFARLGDLSTITMNEAKKRGKISGCEPLHYSRFNANFQGVLKGIDILSKDSVLSVFRFCQNDYRMICKTDITYPDLVYILAFDFDYSAYNHG